MNSPQTTSPDWTSLTPHWPLSVGDPRYVQPPESGGERIADLVGAGVHTVLVGGVAGIGKSTELARAASLLIERGHSLACFAPLDTLEDMRNLTRERLTARLAASVAQTLKDLEGAQLSAAQRRKMAALGVWPEDTREFLSRVADGQLLQVVAAEASRLSASGRVTLLIDGMEKVPDGPRCFELFESLGALPPELSIVVVAPWHVAYGSPAETVIRAGERWQFIHPGDSDGDAGEATRGFLRELLRARLSLPIGWDSQSEHGDKVPPQGFVSLVDAAARWSGGVPRFFLQLVADAGTHARLRAQPSAEGRWPDAGDLDDAVADLEESFRRALMPGDTAAIRAAAGSDGRELDLPRRVRLLARGIVLERLRDRRTIIEVHPLARRAIDLGGGDA